MEHGKGVLARVRVALAVVMVILGFLGFGLTWNLYSVLNSWNTLPNSSMLEEVGYGLFWVLPTLTAIFSLMFELLGLYLLYESRQPKSS
jgi:hypothetical protein